jgi:microcompartment protein CcmL/EutN
MDAALGMLEVTGYVAALEFADVMLKAANVQLITVQKARGMGWLSIFITGDVGAVQAAVAAAKAGAIAADLYVTSQVIPRPGKGLLQRLQPDAKPAPVAEKQPATPPATTGAQVPVASEKKAPPQPNPKNRSRSKSTPNGKAPETPVKK